MKLHHRDHHGRLRCRARRVAPHILALRRKRRWYFNPNTIEWTDAEIRLNDQQVLVPDLATPPRLADFHLFIYGYEPTA